MSQPMTLLSPDMTDAERGMVVAAVRGEVADLAGASVRGTVLRDLILEARPGWLLPRQGLTINRVTVTGGLDLDGTVIDKPVTLIEARIGALGAAQESAGGVSAGPSGAALLLGGTRLRRLTLHACVLGGALVADRIEVEGALLIGGGVIEGPVQLRGGRVRGGLVIEGGVVGDGKVALVATGIEVGGVLALRRTTFRGLCALPRTRVAGGIAADKARFGSETGFDLDLEAARLGGDLILDGAVAANGVSLAALRIDGRVTLSEARIGKLGIEAAGLVTTDALVLTNAHLAGAARFDAATIGKSLSARGMEVHGGEAAVAARGITIGGDADFGAAKLVGTLEIEAARIEGSLDLSGTRLYGSRRALAGGGARIGGGCTLERVIAFGLIDLAGAAVGGGMSLAGASLKVERGRAFDATACRVQGNVDLGEAMTSIGGVRLDHSRIDGAVTLGGSQIVTLALAGQTPAPAASTSQLARSAAVRDEWTAFGASGAAIARLEMPMLAAHRPRGIIDLGDATVGEFLDYAAAWPAAIEARVGPAEGQRTAAEAGRGSSEHIVLTGFTCRRMVNPAGRSIGPPGDERIGEPGAGAQRIAWLEAQPVEDVVTRFKPAPWREVVRHFEDAGLDDDASLVTLAALRRQRALATGRGERWLGLADDVLTRYGHSPWRPGGVLLVMLLLFATLYAAAGGPCAGDRCAAIQGAPGQAAPGQAVLGQGAFERVAVSPAEVPRKAADGHALAPSEFSALGYSFDVLVPMLDLGYAREWRPNPGWRPIVASPLASGAPLLTLGLLLELAIAVEGLAGFALSALLLFGFVRRPRRLA